MKSLWSDTEAGRYTRRYADKNVGPDLALRVYTSRLLGREPKLVLHGGGNTSVKTTAIDPLGDIVDVLCVKGSGWDMADIEPAGLPAVRLDPIRRLRTLKALSDEDMVNAQRINLLDASAPNPSVETLLHAFLPDKFIDHTHAIAVLSVSDQPDGIAICRDLYGDRMGIVPYVMPGFALAKKAAEVYEADPSVDGLILDRHGIFTFGATAREAYELMIEMVSLAESRLRRGRRKVFAPTHLPKRLAAVADVVPILRGLATIKTATAPARFIFEFRTGKDILNYVNGRDVARYSQVGVATPDHTIRTKNWPVILPAPEAGRLEVFRRQAEKAFADYTRRYHRYFARHNDGSANPKKELDPIPRVALVPGLGLFGIGSDSVAAKIAADIAESTIATVTDAEAIGRFRCVSEADMFDMEYWSLEQAKLGKTKELPLARRIVVVTGGGSGIGLATAKAFKRMGAEIAILDRDKTAAASAAAGLEAFTVSCDVTDDRSVRAAFDRVAEAFGGLDIVVSNAGAAWQGAIGDVPDATLRASFELNFFAHQRVAQAALKIWRAQGLGGVLLFNVSKQAINPGPAFGPYGLPKAATLFLMKQYALDHGKEGIRSNAVNADRVRTGLLTEEMITSRAHARGIATEEYMSGNLLHREVKAEDVADAFVALALAEKTTAATLTVDGGNIEASLR